MSGKAPLFELQQQDPAVAGRGPAVICSGVSHGSLLAFTRVLWLLYAAAAAAAAAGCPAPAPVPPWLLLLRRVHPAILLLHLPLPEQLLLLLHVSRLQVRLWVGCILRVLLQRLWVSLRVWQWLLLLHAGLLVLLMPVLLLLVVLLMRPVLRLVRVLALHALEEGAEGVPVVKHEITHAQERQLFQTTCKRDDRAMAAAENETTSAPRRQ